MQLPLKYANNYKMPSYAILIHLYYEYLAGSVTLELFYTFN
jgi:hypothetical protein